MWPNEDRYVSTNSYDDQIVLDVDGITVGGTRVPGCIVSDPEMVIVGTTDLEDHWLLTITLMTGREPRIEDGVRVTSTSTVERVAYAIPPAVAPAPEEEEPHPVREIPYDEMRALLGLPDVSDYIMRRDLARAFGNMRTAFGGFAEVLVEAGQQLARNLESLTEARRGTAEADTADVGDRPGPLTPEEHAMTDTTRSLLDRIDALVDDQLAGGEPETGYDFDDPDFPVARIAIVIGMVLRSQSGSNGCAIAAGSM